MADFWLKTVALRCAPSWYIIYLLTLSSITQRLLGPRSAKKEPLFADVNYGKTNLTEYSYFTCTAVKRWSARSKLLPRRPTRKLSVFFNRLRKKPKTVTSVKKKKTTNISWNARHLNWNFTRVPLDFLSVNSTKLSIKVFNILIVPNWSLHSSRRANQLILRFHKRTFMITMWFPQLSVKNIDFFFYFSVFWLNIILWLSRNTVMIILKS